LAVQAGFAALDLISKPPNQHENDNDDQHGADDADATVSVAITISAEAATEAPKQENEQDDNENEPKRHDLFSLLLRTIKSDAEANAEQNCSQIEARKIAHPTAIRGLARFM
jgi:hypothetical protein